MTNESFAAHLSTAVRTAATWHQKPGRVPSAEMQQASDTTSLGVPSTHLLWLRDAVDHRDHAVTDTDTEAGLIAGHGTYRAICGHTVLACSMLTPPGPPCPTCHERLAAPRPRRHRRGRWWWWWWSR